MTDFRYQLVGSGDAQTLVIVDTANPVPVIIQGSQPNFKAALLAVLDGDFAEAIKLCDVAVAVKEKFKDLTDRVSVKSNGVYFDGELVDDSLTSRLLELLGQDDDWQPLVNFWEKLETNPSPNAKTGLYRWLSSNPSLQITTEGKVFGYKGVNANFTSVNSGFGIVNGEEVDGHLDNTPGNVIAMPRDQVADNPSVACSTGLHVGSWSYASSFASNIVLIEFDPVDVVSVPTDCSDQKIRVRRYKVVKSLTEPLDTSESAFLLSDVDYQNDVVYNQAADVWPIAANPNYGDDYVNDSEDDDDEEEDDDDSCCDWCESGVVEDDEELEFVYNLSTAEIAKVLNIGERSVRRMAESGKLDWQWDDSGKKRLYKNPNVVKVVDPAPAPKSWY